MAQGCQADTGAQSGVSLGQQAVPQASLSQEVTSKASLGQHLKDPFSAEISLSQSPGPRTPSQAPISWCPWQRWVSEKRGLDAEGRPLQHRSPLSFLCKVPLTLSL